jgi:hypothetical protein
MNEMQQNQSTEANNENREDDEIPNLVNKQFNLIFNDSISESLSDSDDSESQKSLSDLDNSNEYILGAQNLLLRNKNQNIIDDESD